MILGKDNNIFMDRELLSVYKKTHDFYHGVDIIQFLLDCDTDGNGSHFWTGNTQELARLIGNGKGDNQDSSNFRRVVLKPLIDRGIIIKKVLKRKTVQYILNNDWKSIIFS